MNTKNYSQLIIKSSVFSIILHASLFGSQAQLPKDVKATVEIEAAQIKEFGNALSAFNNNYEIRGIILNGDYNNEREVRDKRKTLFKAYQKTTGCAREKANELLRQSNVLVDEFQKAVSQFEQQATAAASKPAAAEAPAPRPAAATSSAKPTVAAKPVSPHQDAIGADVKVAAERESENLKKFRSGYDRLAFYIKNKDQQIAATSSDRDFDLDAAKLKKRQTIDKFIDELRVQFQNLSDQEVNAVRRDSSMAQFLDFYGIKKAVSGAPAASAAKAPTAHSSFASAASPAAAAAASASTVVKKVANPGSPKQSDVKARAEKESEKIELFRDVCKDFELRVTRIEQQVALTSESNIRAAFLQAEADIQSALTVVQAHYGQLSDNERDAMNRDSSIAPLLERHMIMKAVPAKIPQAGASAAASKSVTPSAPPAAVAAAAAAGASASSAAVSAAHAGAGSRLKPAAVVRSAAVDRKTKAENAESEAYGKAREALAEYAVVFPSKSRPHAPTIDRYMGTPDQYPLWKKVQDAYKKLNATEQANFRTQILNKQYDPEGDFAIEIPKG